MRVDVRGSGMPLVPTAEPRRRATAYQDPSPHIIIPGDGTGKDSAYVNPDDRVGVWVARQRRWRDGFAQRIVPRVKKYWALYRNFDDTPSAGPRADWRDRTVLPTPFMWTETRLPRIILGTWGGPEKFVVEGMGYRDQEYEAAVQLTMEYFIEKIGAGDANGEAFMKKIIDGSRYCEIVGHVWWKIGWRKETDWLRAMIRDPKVPKSKGKLVELLMKVYDGLDFEWVHIGDLAVDLSGANRWKIHKVKTTYEALVREQEAYAKANPDDPPLYKNLDFLKFGLSGNGAASLVGRSDFTEPRDTEHWPLQDGYTTVDPVDHELELWNCYDNVNRTLTKIVNSSVEIAHGLAPTARGLDPFIGDACVPIPGQVYGDSYLNWSGPLAKYQTRISRARADEILLNIFQQMMYREGAIRSQQLFWRPGGSISVTQGLLPDRPISDLITIYPRKPVFQEAYTEEAAKERMGQNVSAADSVTQGVEATSKSRDVTAAEINQRAVQGASRYQLETLYKCVSVKKPMLGKMFDEIRQNVDPEELKRLFDDSDFEIPMDLDTFVGFDRPVDFIVDDGVFDLSLRERLQEIQTVLMPLIVTPGPATPYLKLDKTIIELLRSTRTLRRRVQRLTNTQQEVQQNAAAAGSVPPGTAPTPPAPGGGGPAPTSGAAPGASGAGAPGSAAFAGPGGAGESETASSSTGVVDEV